MTSINDARIDACDMAENFLDEIVEQLVEKGEASNDINNDYPGGDEYHHSSHIDKSYTLLEAAQLLDDYSEHEESDSGLWEGLEPRRAIEAQAAYTYGNAVASEWFDLIKEINEAVEELSDELEEIDETRATKEKRFNELDMKAELTAEEQREQESIENYDDEATAAKTKAIKTAVQAAINTYKK